MDAEILEYIEDDSDLSDEIEAGEKIQLDIKIKSLEIDTLLKRADKALEKKTVPDTKVAPDAPVKRVKLPVLTIKEFNGDPKEYTSFVDAFKVAVDTVASIPAVEKFTYLRSFLSGEAASAVKGLALTEANYTEAWDILKTRFGSKQVIVNSHMDALIKLHPVMSMEQTKKIRTLYDEIETNLRSLKSIGVEPSSYGCLLVPIIQSKIPHMLNLQISRKFDSKSDVWKIDDIMKALREELEARERCDKDFNSKAKDKRNYDDATIGALYAEQRSREKICPFCEGGHYPDRCNVVTDIRKRKEILINKGRCFVCTKGNHRSADCRSKRGCFKCKKRHHTCICQQDNQEKKRAENQDEKKPDN